MKGVGAALLLLALTAPLLAMSLLDRMIFQPTPGEALRPEGFGAAPVTLHAEDGVRLHAYFVPAKERRLSLLFLHGNAGNASHRLPNAALLAELGVDVLLLDYRGYGLSDRVSPDEAGVYADGRAGLSWLAGRGVPDSEIVVFGRSLGGAIAVDVARGRELAGLILESTFPSVADVSSSFWGVALRSWLGKKFASIDKIGEVRCPILFVHGDRDRLIRIGLGRRLYEAAPEPKAFETVSGAGHNDVVQVGGAAYVERLRAFLDRLEPAA